MLYNVISYFSSFFFSSFIFSFIFSSLTCPPLPLPQQILFSVFICLHSRMIDVFFFFSTVFQTSSNRSLSFGLFHLFAHRLVRLFIVECCCLNMFYVLFIIDSFRIQIFLSFLLLLLLFPLLSGSLLLFYFLPAWLRLSIEAALRWSMKRLEKHNILSLSLSLSLSFFICESVPISQFLPCKKNTNSSPFKLNQRHQDERERERERGKSQS